jgi:NTP pyrophosphatase (non-canonical NTP hydrolase)
MELNDYQQQASKTNQLSTDESSRKILVPMTGLIGEVGSLIAEYKKFQRDSTSDDTLNDGLEEELGDVLWYVATLAKEHNLTLSELAHHSFLLKGATPLKKEENETFDDFQNKAKNLQDFTSDPKDNLFAVLIEISNKTGSLIDSYVRTQEESSRHTLMKVGLASIFWNLGFIASMREIKLSKVALDNLNKATDRWPTEKDYTPLFDENFPAHEQLPRQLKVEFKNYKREEGKSDFTLMTCNGLHLGDRLTDNAHYDNGYRFHDAIHYTFMAKLGWSPVFRSLLKLKRKSNSKADEVEDGARAAVIEEAIIAVVYDYARSKEMLENQKQIDFSLIKLIQRLCHGLEVQKCKAWEWHEAIMVSFDMFRQLMKNEGGCLILDLNKRTIEYKKHD